MSIKTTVVTLVAAVTAVTAGFWYSMYQASERYSATGTSSEQPADSARSSVQKGDISDAAAIEAARKAFSPIQGRILSPARRIALPELKKGDGSAFTDADIKGDWKLWFFGYTQCPDICPTTLGMAASAKRQAESQGKDFPQVIFVSVDPERDSLSHISDYVSYFDRDFIGVTGEPDMLKALTLQMSVVYMKLEAEENSEAGYLVDHSASLLLTNPEGHLVAYLSPPHSPKTILKDLETVTSKD
jgi:protein SCO1/2